MKWITPPLLAAVVFCSSPLLHAEVGLDIIPDDNGDQPSISLNNLTPAKPSPETAKANTAPLDKLYLRNGDRLRGQLKNINTDNGLTWKHPSALKPIEFELSAVNYARIDTRPAPQKRDHNTRIRLTNGDDIPGDLVSVDKEHVTIDTWYTGQLKIYRALVQEIIPGAVNKGILYEGPNNLDEWTLGNSARGQAAWQFKDGVLNSSYQSTIGKDVNLPDMSSIEFELSWSSYAGFMVCFYTDNLQRYYGNCYTLSVSGTSVYLQRYTENGNSSNLGNINLASLGTKRNASFRILTDKEKKSITLLVDGEEVKTWDDTGTFAGRGTSLLFYPQNNYPFKLRNIRVSEWNGNIPNSKGIKSEREEDIIRFTNGDQVTGSLASIKDNKATFNTAFAPLEVPYDRIEHLFLSQKDSGRARRYNEDIRASFHDGGSMTVKLKSMNGNELISYSENYGDVNIKLSAFRNLEFNIYEEKSAEDEEDSW
jgi:hypothetical protein